MSSGFFFLNKRQTLKNIVLYKIIEWSEKTEKTVILLQFPIKIHKQISDQQLMSMHNKTCKHIHLLNLKKDKNIWVDIS